MIQKRRVSLNDVQLDELDERIIITGIDEAAGKDSINAASSAAGYGQRLIRKRRDTLDVTVKFALAIKNRDMPERERLLEKINRWAADGGIMRLDKRPGRRLYVVLAQAPGSGDMFNWANEFTMNFRAYAVPFWEDDAAVTASTGTSARQAATSGSVTLEVPGNTETVVEITVQNWSGADISWIHLKAGDREINFDGVKMGGSATLKIDHQRDAGINVFRARIGSTSVLKARTGANDFTVKPGPCTVTYSAQRAVTLTASVRGRYL